MLRFPRDFRGYIADIQVLSAARKEPLKFSYFFQLHLFVAFILAIVFTPQITDIVRQVTDKLDRLPTGITLEKKNETFSVTGLKEPYTLSDGNFNLTIDTTGVTKERPASSTIFISKEAFEVVQTAESPAQRVLWKDGGDFRIVVDEFKTTMKNNEGAAVVAMTLIFFLYFFVSSMLFSILLVAVWAIIAAASYRFIFGEKIGLRDSFAFHLVAITLPLVLWGICVMLGVTAGPVVEVIAFVVYSIIGLRFGSFFKPQNSIPKK